MTCREASEFLGAYLGDELDHPTRARFEAHLAACPDCRAYLRQYALTRELCRGLPGASALEPGMPEELVRAIIAARGGG